MTETDDPKKMLVIGIVLGALIGILGNIWVGALLNYVNQGLSVNLIVFLVGLIAWFFALWRILKVLQ